jgi:hypothetical protein
MYLVSSSIQIAQQLFIAVGRFRTGQGLIGARDGENHLFRTPGGEKFIHNLPYLTVSVHLNGLRLCLLDDYLLEESEGPGTGYDTIILSEAPDSDSHIVVDYVIF